MIDDRRHDFALVTPWNNHTFGRHCWNTWPPKCPLTAIWMYYGRVSGGWWLRLSWRSAVARISHSGTQHLSRSSTINRARGEVALQLIPLDCHARAAANSRKGSKFFRPIWLVRQPSRARGRTCTKPGKTAVNFGEIAMLVLGSVFRTTSCIRYKPRVIISLVF